MRNFCTYCGFRNTPEATACLGCGSPLDARPTEAPPQPPAPVTQPIHLDGSFPSHSTPPIQVPGGWYSSQQHTPEHPAEPPPGTVSAWAAGQHAPLPPWPLPPQGLAAPLPYGGPYPAVTPGPYQQPYGLDPAPAPFPDPYRSQLPPPPPGFYRVGEAPNAPPSAVRPPNGYPPPGWTPPTGYGANPYGPPANGYPPVGALQPGYGAAQPPYGHGGGYVPAPTGIGQPQSVQGSVPAPYPPSYPITPYGSPYAPVPYGSQAGGLADGGQRFGAYLLDSMVLAIPMFFLLSIVGATESATWAGFWLLALVLCPATYFISAWATTGRTIGYRAMGLRLARSDGGPVSLGAAIARYVTLFACMMFFFPGILGAMWMLWDDKRQGWHDKVADTVVVRS
ncbi:MAG TPA: RDD family protein [Chloroflexota bacterium]|nr:RDD family protein [Chloroflexota bacterium]